MTNRVIYQFWTGDNDMPPDRKAAYDTLRNNTDVPVELVTSRTLDKYIVKDHPLHPAYKYMSCNHKSDYLRCYFMNFHGGGYADIKHYGKNNNFAKSFDALDNSTADIIGSREIRGGAAFGMYNGDHILPRLIACCYFIAKPHTEFTETWYKKMYKYVDVMSYSLRQYPATEPFGGPGYQVPWVSVMGYPFHHTCYYMSLKRNDSILYSLIPDRLNISYR